MGPQMGATRVLAITLVLLKLCTTGGAAAAVQGGSVTLPAAEVHDKAPGAAAAGEDDKGCLQVLKENEEPLRFDQYTKRETIINKLTRRLIMEARKRDKASQSFSIDVKGEDIEEKVGRHTLQARSSGPCFSIAYEIVDVDECAQGISGCHATTRCRNTNGSYECDCPPGMVGMEGQCAGLTTTGPEGCNCTTQRCKQSMQCALPDACGGRCVPEAECVGGKCICPAGLFGSGIICRDRQLSPVFDKHGVLHGPSKVEEDYCGCQPRKVDYCIGVTCRAHSTCRTVGTDYVCACDDGFVEDDGGECVDTRAVGLELLGPARMELEQGDSFDDPFVRIKDDNRMGERTRVIHFDYDPALSNDTLDEVGEFRAHYRIQANWTREKKASATRVVVVKDINECSLKPTHLKWAKWRPICDAAAGCVNTEGGYECHCPKGAVGDGAEVALPGQRRPSNYRDGSGCRDLRPPVVEVMGKPRRISVCKCEGLGSGDGGGGGGAAVVNCPRRDYQKELQALLDRDQGYLCAPQQPQGSGCYRAYKRTWQGVTDLTDDVAIGPAELIKSDGTTYTFQVPLDVTGPYGVRAETQYAQVMVEEVPLATLARAASKGSSGGGDGKAASDLKDCRRELEVATQRATALEARLKRLDSERARSPPTATHGSADVSHLQEHIRSLEAKLAACESRPAPPPPPSTPGTDGATCPSAASPADVAGGRANTDILAFLIVGGLAITALLICACRLFRISDDTELQQQALPPGTRWQESPMPSRNRAPDRTPGSPVRPFRGHVNLSGSKSPFASPAGLG